MRDVRSEDIVIEPRFAGPAYGIPDEATIEAIRLTARLEGMITDPVYEGKSILGLMSMVRSGEIHRSSRILYVHLGGGPAVNAHCKAVDN